MEPSASQARVSVAIVTYNSEDDLPECLGSVEWADEIVVMDLGSSDRTLDIARQRNCRVMAHQWVPIAEFALPEAINACANDWILVLDPDEVVPSTLVSCLQQIALENQADAVSIPWKNQVFGRWIAHSGLAANRHARFFRKGAVSYEPIVHKGEIVKGKLLMLPDEEAFYVIHRGNRTVREFVEKQNRYSTLMAEELFKSGHTTSITTVVRTPFTEVRGRYFGQAGYCDGVQGLAFCELMSLNAFLAEVKLLEKETWLGGGVNSYNVLSESRLGFLHGMWDVMVGMEGTAENLFLRVIYYLLRRILALAIRFHAY